VAPPTRPVLVVIDVQRAIDDPVWGERNNPDAEARIGELLARWRRLRLPVVHVRHDSTEPGSPYRPGQPGHGFKPEVAPIPGETIVAKQVTCAFVGTPLAAILDEFGADAVIYAGVLTQNSVDATVRMSGNLGYRSVVVSDATAASAKTDLTGRRWPAEDVHQLTLANLHGEYATACSTADVLAHWAPLPAPGPDEDPLELLGGRQPQQLVVVDYDPDWSRQYESWRALIVDALGSHLGRIEHIGSTSVPGLAAKPIVDIVITVDDPLGEDTYVPALEPLGLVLRVRDTGHRMLRTPGSSSPRARVRAWCARSERLPRAARLAARQRGRPRPLCRDQADPRPTPVGRHERLRRLQDACRARHPRASPRRLGDDDSGWTMMCG
jgi:nicotinamidase-related amidase/GrpB-like predicted nucleotidyltransferase (UPF0157 family)